MRQTRVAGRETLTSVRLDTLLMMGVTRVEKEKRGVGEGEERIEGEGRRS